MGLAHISTGAINERLLAAVDEDDFERRMAMAMALDDFEDDDVEEEDEDDDFEDDDFEDDLFVEDDEDEEIDEQQFF